MTLVDRREPSACEPDEPPCPRDPEAAGIVAFWRERVAHEQVLDAAGRRPPAHLHVYPLKVPHRWWTARHPRTLWVLRPVWSWTRSITWPHFVRFLGRYPAPVGHPRVEVHPCRATHPDGSVALLEPALRVPALRRGELARGW